MSKRSQSGQHAVRQVNYLHTAGAYAADPNAVSGAVMAEAPAYGAAVAAAAAPAHRPVKRARKPRQRHHQRPVAEEAYELQDYAGADQDLQELYRQHMLLQQQQQQQQQHLGMRGLHGAAGVPVLQRRASLEK